MTSMTRLEPAARIPSQRPCTDGWPASSAAPCSGVGLRRFHLPSPTPNREQLLRQTQTLLDAEWGLPWLHRERGQSPPRLQPQYHCSGPSIRRLRPEASFRWRQSAGGFIALTWCLRTALVRSPYGWLDMLQTPRLCGQTGSFSDCTQRRRSLQP
jgi:hypothetical protein